MDLTKVDLKLRRKAGWHVKVWFKVGDTTTDATELPHEAARATVAFALAAEPGFPEKRWWLRWSR